MKDFCFPMLIEITFKKNITCSMFMVLQKKRGLVGNDFMLKYTSVCPETTQQNLRHSVTLLSQ